MSVEQLIGDLESAGVRFWEEAGDVLRFRAPKGVMTPERTARLKHHKSEVLAYLRRGATVTLEPDDEGRCEPFPLTDVQAAYLMGRSEAFEYGSTGCHGYFEISFPDLDRSRLEHAWQVLIRRHDMLRAVVHKEGYQQVLAEVPDYSIPMLDLRDQPEDSVDRALNDVRAELSHKVYRPDVWPLFELRITRTSGRTVLHVSIDLLIADFLSIQQLLAELDRVYTHPQSPLSGLDVSFRDYVLAERRLRSGVAYERARRYWLERAETLPPAPDLPVRSRRCATAPSFERFQLEFPAQYWQQLRDAAGQREITPSVAVLVAYAAVIARWSRRPDFALNLTLLNRLPLHEQVERLVGDFTSVELLAVHADDGATLVELARTLQSRLWQDMDHRLFSGVEVMREISRRHGQGAAMMPVVFTSTLGLTADDVEQGQLLGSGTADYGISQTPQVWIDCQVMERNGALSVNWDVLEGVFPEGVVESMFEAFRSLLWRMIDDVGAWNEPRPVPLPAVQAERRRAVNDTAGRLPDGLLHERFVTWARRRPDCVAVIAGTTRLTYGELLACANGVARALQQRHVECAEPVAVVMERGWEQVAAVLGASMAGAVYLPIDTTQPVERRNRMMTDAGVRTVLTQSALSGTLEWPQEVDEVAVDTVQPCSPQLGLDRSVGPDDLAYLIYTSGSTGEPKGVMMTHRATLNTIEDINRRCCVWPGDRILALAQLGFDLSVYDVFGVLGACGSLVIPDPQRRRDPAHWADLIGEHGITVWNSVPAQLQMLLDCMDEDDIRLGSLRVALLSGDWIPVGLPGELRRRVPDVTLLSLGGATEAGIWSIHYPVDEVPADWVSIPYGRPLTNQTFHVLDAHMESCPDWVPGDLYIGGASLASGYWRDEKRSRASFLAHPRTGERLYRTGDLGRYLPDGNIEFLGRDDDQVKIRGHRIELAEIESALLTYPAVGAGITLVAGEGSRGRLEAFVEPARVDAAEAVGEALEASVRAMAAAMEEGVRGEDLQDLVQRMDRVALLCMTRALRRVGAFTEPDAAYTADEIAVLGNVADRHRRLLRRWLTALWHNALIEFDPATGRYRDLANVDDRDIGALWQKIDRLQQVVDYGGELMRYLRESTEHLPELLRDEIDPLDLLFPQGRLETAEAAYQDNFISRYLNAAVTTALRQIVERFPTDDTVRILEVGAGVGGTSAELIPALAELPVDYQFTDVSRFFLNEARERFADYPFVRFGLFDVNEDYRRQGYAPNSVDVIVCANVLHNARDATVVLTHLRELLRPGGWLLFIEATRDNYQLMTSMEFKEGLTDFADFRAGGDMTFVPRDKWLQLLEGAGADHHLVLPEADNPISAVGQHFFAARFKADRARIDEDAVRRHMAQRLPEYMLPTHIHCVDALPLNGNGKIDRTTLTQWLSTGEARRGGRGTAPGTETERRLHAVWTQVLEIDDLGVDDDFFECGGDSLLVAQLVGRLREELGDCAPEWDRMLRKVLEQPTITALATWLDQEEMPEPDTSRESPGTLVQLKSADRGRPTVLVHEGSGTLLPYQPLMEVYEGGALYGLAPADKETYLAVPPQRLIETLASRYVDDLVGSGVDEPPRLVGYCMGGLIVLEMARQLAERGHAAAGVTVISSYKIPYLVEDELLAEYAFLRVLGLDPGVAGFPEDDAAIGQALQRVLAATPGRLPNGAFADLDRHVGLEEVAASFASLAEEPPAHRLERYRAMAAASSAGEGGQRSFEHFFRVFRHSLQAVTLYEPGLYTGEVEFLRQQGGTYFLPGLREDMTAFWQEVSLGGLRVVDIPGDHFGCMRSPHVQRIASVLQGAATLH
ncbi:amino acid adenylation domain-containing protein [Arhodomonas sp. AD133]|uniref:non-ribosomal peptide synthetase n=1 Tax=Arhodomonas sp. AD133 TaxID=3415009 RepID=UPI003EBEC89B